MAKRFWRKQVLLAKIESVYGTDATPTAMADAMLFTNSTITPIEGDEIERDYYLPYLGHQGIIPVGMFVRLQFSCDLAGSGVAGTAPGYGPLLRACSMAETIVADTSVAYSPVSSGQEAVTFYFNLDGVRHVGLGGRGTWQITQTPKGIPRIEFNFMALLGAITDVALPAPTLTAFLKAIPISKTNTTLALHGLSNVIAESVSFVFGNQVETRMLIGEDSIQIVDRKVTGTAVVEAASVATKDWDGIYKAETKGALEIVHGVTAGNIVTIGAPVVQIGKPTYGQTQGIVNRSLPLICLPTSGNDDLTLTFT